MGRLFPRADKNLRTTALCLTLLLGLASSAFAQWTPDGVKVCGFTGTQGRAVALPDGRGGATIAWEDYRNSTLGPHTFVQRIDAAGVPQWAQDGIRLRMFPSGDRNPKLAPDGRGGTIVAFRADGGGIYAQRIDADGSMLWIENGVALFPGSEVFSLAGMVSDGAGGAIVAWIDNRDLNQDLYVQRVSADGVVLWGNSGLPVCVADGLQQPAYIVPDDHGGAILAWSDKRALTTDIYAQRVDETGSPLWLLDGVPVCTESHYQEIGGLVAVGGGGAIVTWSDNRGPNVVHIYAQRLNAVGKVSWKPDGVLVSGEAYGQSRPVIARDGANGAIIAWEGDRNVGSDVRAQRIQASGRTLWTPGGVTLCTAAGYREFPEIVADGAGGAVITWSDTRGDDMTDIYGQRVNATGTAAWSLDGVALSTSGSARLVQTTTDSSGGAIVVWNDISNGVDQDVFANHVDANGSVATALYRKELTVAQQSSAAPSVGAVLSPNSPNPFSVSTHFDLSLVDEGGATVDVFDVAGRRVRHLDIARGNAALVTVAFDGRDDQGRPLPSGVYFYRATTAGAHLTRKMLLLR